MHILAKSNKVFVLVGALALMGAFLPKFALAQGGDIVSAQYGADNSWKDVTNQVRNRIRSDGTLNFRVNNDAFGVGDPARNVKKTLRLRVRTANGRTQDYQYIEGQVVSLQLGYSNNPVPPNRPYPGNNNYRLRQDDQRQFDDYYSRWLTYQRTNNQRGMRDMENNMRQIYANYRIPNNVPFDQVASPNLGQPGNGGPGYGNPGWNSDLRVVNAQYGTGGRNMMNVTGRVQGMVRNGTLNFRVNNDSMGGDPAPNQRKQLYLTYWYQGGQRNITVSEGNDVRLP